MWRNTVIRNNWKDEDFFADINPYFVFTMWRQEVSKYVPLNSLNTYILNENHNNTHFMITAFSFFCQQKMRTTIVVGTADMHLMKYPNG